MSQIIDLFIDNVRLEKAYAGEVHLELLMRTCGFLRTFTQRALALHKSSILVGWVTIVCQSIRHLPGYAFHLSLLVRYYHIVLLLSFKTFRASVGLEGFLSLVQIRLDHLKFCLRLNIDSFVYNILKISCRLKCLANCSLFLHWFNFIILHFHVY